MFWAQAGLSFILWIGLGIFLARLKPELQGWISKLSRNARIVGGAGLMVFCLTFLFVPLDIILSLGGLKSGAMSIPIWLIVTMSGLCFVGANTVAMGLLVAVARDAGVTEEESPTSTQEDSDR